MPLFRPFAVGNVADNFGRADDIAAEVSDWRNGERNIDGPSILALSDRLVMVDLLTAADAFEDLGSSSWRSAGMSIVTFTDRSWAV